MKKIFAYFLFFGLCAGHQVILTRKQGVSGPGHQLPRTNITIKLKGRTGIETIPIQRFAPLRLFRDFSPPQPRKGRQTLNILVLKVEFVEDTDSLTTGNGKMDLKGFNTPDSGLFYDPPHTKSYFHRQMQFLSNFYKANSFGNCVVNWVVKPDHPIENYQLPHKMRYYSGYDHYDPATGFVYYNTYGMEMGLVRILTDAIAAADEDESIDFSDYDAMVIFHAGTLLQTGINFYHFCDIPSATIPPGALEYYLGVPYIIANAGTDTIDYPVSINSEMARVGEYMVSSLGTAVHEFGHILGLPDLYDVTGWSNGVGAWDLMCTGAWVGNPLIGAPEGSIPANLGAWTRYAMGWVNPLVVNQPESLLTVRASEIDTTQYQVVDQTMIKVPISNTEFFLIENRQQDIKHKDTIIVDVEDGVPVSVDNGEYDFFLPGSGILVWHIDDNVINANWGTNTVQIDPKHKGIDLEEADGIQHFDAWWYGDSLEYYGSKYDPFWRDDSGKANYNFGPFTNPNSDSYFGKSLVNIEVKSNLDTLMSFSLNYDFYQAGFPVVIQPGRPVYAVSYGDLDSDGELEIIAENRYGFVFAYNRDGTLYGNYSTDTITTYPAIGDVNGDGADDIVFGAGFKLVCLDGRSLTPMPGFPFIAENVILGAPLLFDIDDDDELEIIFGAGDRKLYALNKDGTNIDNFPLNLNTEIYSTPCVFDPDKNEIGVLGSDGRFWLIGPDSIINEFNASAHNMISYASPIVGDIDRDGRPEAVVVNGYGTIYIYGEDSLEEKFDILIDTTFYFTPALADLDEDGYLELIMPNSSKTLYVCNRNGTSENNFPLHTDDFILPPLLIADLDDDGKEEIVFGLGTSDSLGFGQLKLINDRNRESSCSPLFGEGGFSSSGVIFDLDGDGDLELACGSDSGKLYVWDFPGTEVSWSGYMNSPKNWGYFKAELNQPKLVQGLLGSFYIYPSPVEDYGWVRFFLNQEAEVRVDILDIAGHRIGSANLPDPTANEYNEIRFDFSKQSNGVYIVRVQAKGENRTEVKFKKFAVLK